MQLMSEITPQNSNMTVLSQFMDKNWKSIDILRYLSTTFMKIAKLAILKSEIKIEWDQKKKTNHVQQVGLLDAWKPRFGQLQSLLLLKTQ